MPKNPLASDPTRPWYLLRDEYGSVVWVTQDPASADGVPPDDVVAPEWPRADWCGKRTPHEPHVWGGEGWSDFRCAGMMRRTFAELEQWLEEMPVCSLKYRLFDALYAGRLTDGMTPNSLEKSR